jgi:hypothetical protein
MGLLANLRELCASDVGSVVRELRTRLMQLETDFDEMRDLTERRFRRVRKRDSDETERTNGSAQAPPMDARVGRILARRARRGMHPAAQGD